MKVLDFLELDSVTTDLKSQTKQDAISELCELLKANGRIVDADAVKQSLLEREKLGSTGIQDGVAIPHGKFKALAQMIVLFGRSLHGIDFQSFDNRPTHLFFVLLAPEDSVGADLHVLARLSRLIKDEKVCQTFNVCEEGTLYQLLIDEDDKL